ncbi:PQQ-binding-like beta-propeller repeat protein [Williamsia sp. 1138]|nr:PQQ-binding-like beta-propeller repeat protein [Williamsia sp. 1138]
MYDMLKGRSAPGIGIVVLTLSIAMVISVGLVLSMGTPTTTSGDFSNGQLRSYQGEPTEQWSLDLTDMRTYGEGATPVVAGTLGDIWLIAYPSGLGTTYLAIDRRNGERLWDVPIDAGLGSCAINGQGELGCALSLTDRPDGFYLADLTSGELRGRSDIRNTRAVTGFGPDFLRVNDSGYQVSRNAPDGRQIWARTFAAAAKVEVQDDVVAISASDGSKHIIDPATGIDRIGCDSCDMEIYPSGVALQFTGTDEQRVEFYRADGTRTSVNDKQQLVSGTSVLPVTTGTGPAQIMQTQGTYAVFDPPDAQRLWQITDPELSKVNTRPCGSVVIFALKDATRTAFDLRSGEQLGRFARPDLMNPAANIDYLSCVGQGGDIAVFGNGGELTAFDVRNGSIAWQRSIVGGQAEVVDGYLVLEEGSTLTMLAPS